MKVHTLQDVQKHCDKQPPVTRFFQLRMDSLKEVKEYLEDMDFCYNEQVVNDAYIILSHYDKGSRFGCNMHFMKRMRPSLPERKMVKTGIAKSLIKHKI